MHLLLLVGLACLFPVALYCLYLAMLHNRRNPTMISGSWDFAGVLIALSGFLLIGGTLLVFGLNNAARDYWFRGGGFADLRRVHTQVGTLTFAVWGIYTLALLGGSAWLISLRGAYTSVYNITPADLEEIIGRLCGRLGLSFGRGRGARLLLGYELPAPLVVDGSGSAAITWSGSVRKAALDLDGSAAMRHVSVRWVFASEDLRSEFEAELARDLAQFETSPGHVAGWFLTAAAALMILMIFGLAAFLILATK